MYYDEQEAAEKLGCSVEDLTNLVQEEKIRVFKDGLRNVYNAEEVDKLLAERTSQAPSPEELAELAPSDSAIDLVTSEETDVQEVADLAPSDSAIELMVPEGAAGEQIAEDVVLAPAEGSDALSLDEAIEAEEAEAPEKAKEDTVLSTEGASIFEQGDFDVEPADPMAKTQVAPSLEEQVAREGVGSGSGLLDLTRESDDTSLGAEILEHIDADAGEAPVPVEEMLAEPSGLAEAAEGPAAQPAVGPVIVEAPDPMAALFGGVLVGCAVVVVLIGGIALAAMTGYEPSYLKWINANMLILVIAAVAVVGDGALAGFMIGKSAADKQAAIQRAGG